MITPAKFPVRMLPNECSAQLRDVFRHMVNSKMINMDMGHEATEEILENLYDIGKIKLSIEPSPSIEDNHFRVLFFDDTADAYRIVTKIQVDIADGFIHVKVKLPNADTGL